jgi:HTH-type transcriptional regulator, transcriptional repressor of NAD biosynthesis genes
LVIGRFHPPHRGHKLLIDTAAAQADRVTVIAFGRTGEEPSIDLRGKWLAAIHPEPHVRVVALLRDRKSDFADPLIWEEWMRDIRAAAEPFGPVDVVFSSEPYGSELARRLDATEVVVDVERNTVPISGTAIRADPLANADFLEPVVRAWYEQST